MKKCLIGLSCLLCSFFVHASSATIYPTLILDSISQIKTSEKYGDEIYWVVTEFKSSRKNLQYMVPQSPVHWPAKALSSIRNLKLWEGKLSQGQSSILYLELVEHDASPFDVDDSIGSMRLVIKNDKGQLKVDAQNSENVKYDASKQGSVAVQELLFHGEGGEYLVKMHFS